MKKLSNDISSLIDAEQKNPDSFIKDFFGNLLFMIVCFGVAIGFGLTLEAAVKWMWY